MKLAPYGKNLQSLNYRPFYVFIFMGWKGWDRAKNFHSHFPETLVLPSNCSPFDYAWPVHNHDVIVLDTSITNYRYVREFVACLFSFGANVVKYQSINVPMTQFEKESDDDI